MYVLSQLSAYLIIGFFSDTNKINTIFLQICFSSSQSAKVHVQYGGYIKFSLFGACL